MKTRNFKSLAFIFLSLFAVVVMLFGYVPESNAQSVQNWSNPINLSNSGSVTNPSLVVDGNGVFHALWVDTYDGYKYAESTDGITWTSPEIVKFPFTPKDSQPMFVVDSKGYIHIFWRSSKNILQYAKTLQENFGSPSTWLSSGPIDTFVYDFDVKLDANSKLHIGYIRNPVTKKELSGVYYRQSDNGGSSWSGGAILYESKYFRSLTPENAHIRMSVSGDKVYAVWDDRPLKRIFMAKSNDAGLSWGAPTDIIVPEAGLGFKAPFNIEIDEFRDTILLMWQVGEPGVRCTQFSRWSADGGETWSEPTKMLDEFISCPESSRFLPVNQNYSMALLSIQGDLALVAWNGEAWSALETQSGLSLVSNPITFDTIIFRCQQVVPYGNNLYVAGCDQGAGGDIWFTSRQLDPAEILFPPPSAWGIAKDITTASQKLSSLYSIPDQENNVHVLWVQSSASEADSYEPKIQYMRWNGKNWSTPVPVITDLKGFPVQLSVAIDNQQRLLLVWVDEASGDMLFSWANSSRANIPSEWEKPIVLPSLSTLNSSPDILVDASGQIVVVYAVTVNENRGIYLIRSSDLGGTWSPPLRIFDAISAGWESVDQPKLALTGDGHLHLLFTQFSTLGKQPSKGLYYSQSLDGGVTWSNPEVVSEQSVRWSEIIGYDQQTVHRVWQESDKSINFTYHQFSQDGGTTWGTVEKIASTGGTTSVPVLSMDWSGNLHFIQLLEDNQTFQESEWVGSRWSVLESKKLKVERQSIPVSISSGVTSSGELYALVLSEQSDPDKGFNSRLLNISRSLDLGANASPLPISLIATPVATSVLVATPDVSLTPIPTEHSPLAGLNESSTSSPKKIAGVILIVAVVLVVLIFVLPSRKKD